MISFYIRKRLRHLRRFFSKNKKGRVITAGLLTAVLLVVGLGVYGLLVEGFSAVAENEFLRVGLPYFIYELFLLVTFGLVFASAAISSLFLLFRNDRDGWVLASPQYKTLLFDKFLTVTTASIWPLLVIAVPALAAMQTVFSVGALGLLVGFLSVFILGLMATSAALAIILAVGYLLHTLNSSTKINPDFSWLLSIVAVLLVGLAGFTWGQLADLNVVTLFNAENLNLQEAGRSHIAQFFWFTPSHFVALILSAVQTSTLSSIAAPALLLAGITAVLAWILAFFAKPFLTIWQHFQEGNFEASPQTNATVQQSANFSNRPIRAVFKKEWLTMSRDKRSLFWLGFLSLLWLIVTGFDFFMQQSLQGENLLSAVTIPQLIQSLQIVVIGYFLAALVLRFVFPAFSMERDTAWSIITAPVPLKRLFWAKASFYLTTMTIISLLVSIIHIIILQNSINSAFIFTLYVLIISITLTLVGLSMGTRFPNFTTDNPETLSTTLPGLSFVGIAIVYGSTAAYSLYAFFSGYGIISLILFIILSLILAFGFVRSALTHLPNIDFVARVES